MSNEKQSSIDKEFVPYTEASALKKLGFNEPCFGYFILGKLFVTSDTVYNSLDIPVCKAPTFSQAFRWFREKYDIDIDMDVVFSKHDDGISLKNYKVLIPFHDELFINVGLFTTYEEAELACLRKLIEIVQGGKK